MGNWSDDDTAVLFSYRGYTEEWTNGDGSFEWDAVGPVWWEYWIIDAELEGPAKKLAGRFDENPPSPAYLMSQVGYVFLKRRVTDETVPIGFRNRFERWSLDGEQTEISPNDVPDSCHPKSIVPSANGTVLALTYDCRDDDPWDLYFVDSVSDEVIRRLERVPGPDGHWGPDGSFYTYYEPTGAYVAPDLTALKIVDDAPAEEVPLPSCRYPRTTSSWVSATGRVLCGGDDPDDPFHDCDAEELVWLDKFKHPFVPFGCP